MEIDDLRALTSQELANQLESAHQELFNLRFRLASRQLVNHRELPRMRKRIARIQTMLKARELGSKA